MPKQKGRLSPSLDWLHRTSIHGKPDSDRSLDWTPSLEELAPIRLLTIADLQQLFNMGRSSIYALMQPEHKSYDKTFPRSVKLGSSKTMWRYEEIVEWISNLPRSSPTDQNQEEL